MTIAKYGRHATKQIEYQEYMLNDYLNSKEHLNSVCCSFQTNNSSLNSSAQNLNHFESKNKKL
jgi:hypothetical protein